MTGGIRVHALAKELGLSSIQVMAELRRLRCFPKSASSLIEQSPADAIRLWAQLRVEAKEDSQRFVPKPPPMALNRREWYRGPQPAQLVSMILDRVIVPERRRAGDRAPGPGHLYFDDEVKLAMKLSGEWSESLLEGLQPFDVIEWMTVVYPPIQKDDAVHLQQHGVQPADLQRDPTGRGPDLAFRLRWGNVTAEQIVEELGKDKPA